MAKLKTLCRCFDQPNAWGNGGAFGEDSTENYASVRANAGSWMDMSDGHKPFVCESWPSEVGDISQEESTMETAPNIGCWLTLPQLVPDAHSIAGGGDISSQGDLYLTNAFCADWRTYLSYDHAVQTATTFGSGRGSDTIDPAACSDHSNCAEGNYCDNTQHCWECGAINAGWCDAFDGDTCCTADFGRQCPVAQFPGLAERCAATSAPAPSGSVVLDGGGDMYDIGNLIVTSLMADCDTSSDAHDCPLGSLHYHSGFERVPTNCFGANGHYQMQQLDGMWVFFTHNSHSDPLDFMIRGNLGADETGTVTEFVFESTPFTAFVKRVCGAADNDPSVNHLIIVDSTLGRPTHTCDYTNGGECTGSNADLDDDVLQGIAPGSPILYLLYSNVDGRCMKADQHREILSVAKLCIQTADPYAAINLLGSGYQALAEVDVDSASHISFGGKAPYAGWARGPIPIVEGPSGHSNALEFREHESLQLGDSGITVDGGDWTVDVYFQVSRAAVRAAVDRATLLESAQGEAHVATARGNEELGPRELGAVVAGRWQSAHIDVASLDHGWHRLTVVASAIAGHGVLHSFGVAEDAYRGCFADPSSARDLTGVTSRAVPRNPENAVDCSNDVCTFALAASTHGGSVSEIRSACAYECQDFRYFGLQWMDTGWTHRSQCLCGNEYQHSAANHPIDGCGDLGENCAQGNEHCGNRNAVFEMADIPGSAMASSKQYAYHIDGELAGSLSMDLTLCSGQPCPTNFFSIGGRADGTAPFPFPIHRFRLFEGHVQLDSVAQIGIAPGELLQYQSVNSRSVKISRGTDGMEVRWDLVGWNAATHEHVAVAFDSSGGMTVRAHNATQSWNRAVASASHVADARDVLNLTVPFLPSNRLVQLHIKYIDSDPCFDLVCVECLA
jgi:hypothetical protein